MDSTGIDDSTGITYHYWRWRLLIALGERQRYKHALAKLPRLIESNQFQQIESLLVTCGSFQVASNFRDLVTFVRSNSHTISKIVEIGTFNFASSTLINLLKSPKAIFYGFDNWDLGGAKAKAVAQWRSKCFLNSYVISGHPLSSTLAVQNLSDTDMLIVDGNHSFQSTLEDCGCFEFLKDGAAVFFHDRGIGNRIWGCFWVYYLMTKYGIVVPYDDRFAYRLLAVNSRFKPALSQGEKPEIEFAIGIFRRDKYDRYRHLLQNSQRLWDEVRDDLRLRDGLDMATQSYMWDEWFC